MCVPGVNDFVQVEYVNNASVNVLWSGPDVTYNLETDVDPLTGTIYTLHNKVCILQYS